MARSSFRFASPLRWIAAAGVTALGTVATPTTADAAEPAACLSSDPSAWPAAAKPYFMLVVDTSSSMTACTTPPTTYSQECNQNAAGYKLNSCGMVPNRVNDAKCALRQTVQAFAGEANFGLATFAPYMTSCPAGACVSSCGTPNGGTCGTETYGCSFAGGANNGCGTDPSCNSGAGLPPPSFPEGTWRNGTNILVPLLQDPWWLGPPPPASNVNELLKYFDGQCGDAKELFANGWTPIADSLRGVTQYLRAGWRRWSTTDYCPSTALTYATPLDAADRACRSVNVLLVTDGDEFCNGDPVAAADDLYQNGVTLGGTTWPVKVHVINFAGGSQVDSDAIAAAGGTTSSKFATDEVGLAKALSQIIASAIKPETCDNADNNCNGCTDEGFKHYCDVGQTCCAWTTAAQRTTCLSTYTATITPANPTGDKTQLPCTTTAQQTQPANWLCYDPGEICDDVDNNCQSGVDEGITKCGSPLACPTTEVCDGKDNDCDGLIDEGVCNGCVATPEICDGCDNDCDGIIDNGIAAIPCGQASPPNCVGQITCKTIPGTFPPGSCVSGGGFNTCNNSPQAETCDGVDNDCNGLVDDGIALVPCVPAGTPVGLVYGGTSQCVMGQKACNGTCQGFVGPSAEICDGVDNDCDGVVDDAVPGVGAPCGVNTPPCSAGVTACVNGALTCQGGVQPQPEMCDGIDNNCNGTVDEAPLADGPGAGLNGCWTDPGNCCSFAGLAWCPPAGAACNGNGTLSTPCNKGSLACQGGAWTCQNAKGPTAEVCDGIDNNCNGSVDDGIALVGTACGSNVGECKQGVYQCSGGGIACVGAVGPTAEICDGKDNDCNGSVDDAVPGAGVACGNATPPCSQGATACVGGAMICQGGVQPQAETCDGVDNDCDGQIDEGPLADAPPAALSGCWSNPGNCCTFANLAWCPPAGATCNDVGTLTTPCNKGSLACQAGVWSCQGPKAPSTEVCDGLDNNCNGVADDGIALVGTSCGTNVGECVAGVYQCSGGVVSCVGAVGPTPEVCDGKDNDCDGQIDETVPGAGVACGNATPPCSQGVTACVNGALVCQGGVGPQAEVCDGKDNDCDGQVDEAPLADAPPGGQNGCWNLPGNCCTFDNLSWCPPAGASCNGKGALTSPCAPGTLACAGAAGWACQGGATPVAEVCDGVDNNCDGTTDNVPPTDCEPPGTPAGLVYGGTSQCVKGKKACGACVGFVGPSAEICDGKDNDCDGVVDEGAPGVGAPCGINQPPCSPGVTACVNGSLVCTGGVGPQPEVCDGIDNNCDGVPDNPPLADAPLPGQNGCWSEPGACCTFGGLTWCPPAGATCNGLGTLSTPCKQGSLTCAGLSGWICQGPKTPAAEACDGLDNDCNGVIDDGNLPQVGQVCGANIGECKTGVLGCTAGVLDCVGDVGPTQEACDGLDNDCDGVIDNGIPTGGPCAPAYDPVVYPGVRTSPPCQPGVLQCNGMGGLECVGGVGPQPEVCDGIDNDCDGVVDEVGVAPDGINGSQNPLPPPAAAIGDACGLSVGECTQGAYACLNGSFACLGGQGAVEEQCDCKDNDCDGTTDNQTPGGSPICSGGKACVAAGGACQCAAPCGSGEFTCPPGQACQQVTSSETGAPLGGYCVTDFSALCGDCTAKTVKDAKDVVQCAPAGTALPGCITPPVCVCKGPNGCQEPCFGVTCDAGLVCANSGPKAGTCLADNCFNNLCQGCGKACNLGSCVDNPCKEGSCPTDQVCKPNDTFTDFTCVDSCVGVDCSAGTKCVGGQCAPSCDPPCAAGQVCDASASPPACVTDQCASNPCVNGGCCDPVTGACGNCPCEGVLCPTGQACKDGECLDGTASSSSSSSSSSSGGSTSSSSSSGSSSSGSSGGGAGGSGQQGVWGLATGGGGCRCGVAGERGEADAIRFALFALALGVAARRRRRRSGGGGEVAR